MARARGGQHSEVAGRRSDPAIAGGITVADALRAHDPRKLLAALARHEVCFVLVGGLAAVIHGATRPTEDVDVTPATDPENLTRLAAALNELGAQLLPDGLAHGVPFHFDAGCFRLFTSMAVIAPDGLLDVAFMPDGTGGYPDLSSNAAPMSVLGVRVSVAALDDIIRSKEHADRPKDHDALPELRALRQRR